MLQTHQITDFQLQTVHNIRVEYAAYENLYASDGRDLSLKEHVAARHAPRINPQTRFTSEIARVTGRRARESRRRVWQRPFPRASPDARGRRRKKKKNPRQAPRGGTRLPFFACSPDSCIGSRHHAKRDFSRGSLLRAGVSGIPGTRHGCAPNPTCRRIRNFVKHSPVELRDRERHFCQEDRKAFQKYKSRQI